MNASMSPLTRALDPTSIVIVGASDDPDKVGGRPLFYLSRFGFKGRVYPVNPKRSHVQGQLALRSVADVPEQPDRAIIALPSEGAV
jgi:acyl-CoA synthetase (NDP forming)